VYACKLLSIQCYSLGRGWEGHTICTVLSEEWVLVVEDSNSFEGLARVHIWREKENPKDEQLSTTIFFCVDWVEESNKDRNCDSLFERYFFLWLKKMWGWRSASIFLPEDNVEDKIQLPIFYFSGHDENYNSKLWICFAA